jgi:predicted phage terminase large subunit-like protein
MNAFTQLGPQHLRAVRKRQAELSLYEFVKQAWPIVEGDNPFVDSWHVKAICDHLQSLAKFEIPHLGINVPPRALKSLLCAVMFPAWVWTLWPEAKFIFASYADNLAKRDQEKTRRLWESPWYQTRWPTNLIISRQDKIENARGGYRIKTSVGGQATGEGGHFVVCDDPLSVSDGTFSEVKRLEAIDWWNETMANRYVDPDKFRRLIIMQRMHDNDLSGFLQRERKDKYIWLILPAEFEPDRRCVTPIFTDPREIEGEPISPRYSPGFLRAQKIDLGEYAYAGQMQQSPVPRGKMVFQVDLIQRIASIPNRLMRTIRYWDKAGTEGGGAYTAGVKMGQLPDGRFIILDVKRGQWSWGNREMHIKAAAVNDGYGVEIWVEQEPGSGGKESAESTIRNLAGFMVYADPVGASDGNKERRAAPLGVQVENGNVLLLDTGQDWVTPFLDELRMFPVGRYKDQVDAAAGAFNRLTDNTLDWNKLLTM